MRDRKKLFVLALVALAVAVTAIGCKQSTETGVKPEAQPKAPVETVTGAKPEATAPAKLPVEIVAYYPLNPDHMFIIDYLKEFARKHPGQVSLTVWDMQSPEGRRKWSATELGCAGVFVNGKTHYEIARNGRTETVDFVRRMGINWSQEDFETVVKQLLEKSKKAK